MPVPEHLKSLLGDSFVSADEAARRARDRSNARATVSAQTPPSATEMTPTGTPAFDASHPLYQVQVTDAYRDVEDRVRSGERVVYVSGKAGTGKSTLVHYLRHALGMNTAVVAPTGVAALHVGGMTLHAFFKFAPRVLADADIKPARNPQMYRRLQLLIIDEVSMVRADLMDAIDRFLRLNGPTGMAPFGGVQVVLIGDLFQLPPVVTSADAAALEDRAYETPYFFSADVFREAAIAPVELAHVYRQHDGAFTELLNRIRTADDLDRVIPALNAACFPGAPDSMMTLACTNRVADGLNAAALDALAGSASTYVGKLDGAYAADEGRLPSPAELTLKPGAQVMFTKNDAQRRWVNGTVGRVVEIDRDSVWVELVTDHPGRVFEVEPTTWEFFRYAYDRDEGRIRPEVAGSFTQIPLMLAWAVTIHKSQGKTLERVRVDLGSGAFAPGQTYVALSRCRSIEDISLSRPLRRGDIRADARVIRFYRELTGRNKTTC